MLPLYALELGGGAGLAATFLGLNGLGRMAAALPSGTAISRFGDKRTMLGGLIVLIAAMAALCPSSIASTASVVGHWSMST